MKSTTISSLIENQIPNFILEEYPLFKDFLSAYYEQQEVSGGPLDIINNLDSYRNINTYDKNLLKKSTKLNGSINATQSEIVVDSTAGFPENGIIKIDDELISYKSKTDTQFNDVTRGISGNTTLGNLYSETRFTETSASSHIDDTRVENISNLFIYALIQSFESEYLHGIPEKYLRGEIDKRTLIKNISDFYSAKGTDRSVQFIFNSIITSGETEVFYPKENTVKASDSDWVNEYVLKVSVLSGNPEDIVGKEIRQTTSSGFASAVVDSVYKSQLIDGVQTWDIILFRNTINSQFKVVNQTTLEKQIDSTDTVGDKIDVESTFGWDKEGSFYVNQELVEYSSKNIKQFVIKSRSSTGTQAAPAKIYSNDLVTSGTVKLFPVGVVYNLFQKETSPYSIEGESVVVGKSGFDTVDPIIKTTGNAIRWLQYDPSNSTHVVQSGDARTVAENADTIPGISHIFADDDNYYFCSSGFPYGRTIFFNQTLSSTETPVAASFLRTIRKSPEITTEIYETPRKDAAILVDGTLAHSYKSKSGVFFGALTKINVTNQGSGYLRPPFVLINNTPYKASAVLSGNVVESITIDEPGSYSAAPVVDIVSGRNGVLTPVVTQGKITSLIISNAGEYYSAPPTIRITDNLGRGRFADYEAKVSAVGQITEVVKLNEGNFYTAGQVRVDVIPAGSNAAATSEIYEWVKNKYVEIGSDKDTQNGFSHLAETGFYNYGVIAYPPSLKSSLNDQGSIHSPIIGYAYDGNPIYGPWGYSNPLGVGLLERMSSGYRLRTTRTNGPSVGTYPLGTFIQDYYYSEDVGTLDRNNGRYCVTPEYPNGVYAYFTTEDNSGVPQFPYILGENYYSLPFKSNYENVQTHNDLPADAKRLRNSKTPNNGLATRAVVQDVTSGNIDGFRVLGSSDNLKVGSSVLLDSRNTSGQDALGVVTEISGKSISSIKATDAQKVASLQITENCYVFAGDTLSQPSSGASGRVVGDVADDKFIVLEDVNGTFDAQGLFDASTVSLNLILNTNASFTKGAILSYTDGDAVIATGEVIETTDRRNSVKVKVVTGSFAIASNYYLRSNNLLDTIGAEIISTSSLSTGLIPFKVVTDAALVTTSVNHGLSVGDTVDIRIDPNDTTTTKTYYVQLGAIQELELITPVFNTQLNEPGIGRTKLLNTGRDYATNTYNDVELIFADQTATRTDLGAVGDANNARATIVVNDLGSTGLGTITSLTITTKGEGYRLGDILTVEDSSLNRSGASTSTQRLLAVVDHIGFATGETTMRVLDVSEIAQNDFLQVGEEIVKVTAIAEATKTLTVQRAQNGTSDIDHYDKQNVNIVNPAYNFTVGNPIALTGNTTLDPKVVSYSGTKLIVEHNQNFFQSGDFAPYKVSIGSSFFDESDPKKLVRISSVSDYKIVTKISENAAGPYVIDKNLTFQKYYQYRFDLSHFTNSYSIFEVSPSQSDNIITPEFTRVGNPGTSGAYGYVKFGYGPEVGSVISYSGTTTDRKLLEYQRYYYKSIIKTTPSGVKQVRIGPSTEIEDNDAYFELIDDPLQNQHTITYVTSNRFLYEIPSGAEWYGTGSMSYVTSSISAVGEAHSVGVSNLGFGYKKLPTLIGATVPKQFEAVVSAGWDSANKNISGVTVSSKKGKYSKPIVFIEDGDGVDAEFQVIKAFDDSVASVIVLNKGKNFTYKPTLKIIESDIKAFASSSNIGIAKNVKIEYPGNGIWNDTSLLKQHSASIAMVVDVTNNNQFLQGEIVTQGTTSGQVSLEGWRIGSNVLKVSVISGKFVPNQTITGTSSRATANPVTVLENEFEVSLRSYYDNIGKYTSDRGKIGVRNQRLSDNDYYQDYSYVIESDTQVNEWRDLVKQSTHPAGFKVFGELNLDVAASANIASTPRLSQISKLTLFNSQQNTATVQDTKKVHQSVLNLSASLSTVEGSGSISPKAFDTSALIARDITLQESFDGAFNSSGILQGRKQFTLVDTKTNQPIAPFNAMALTITIDGILQEPEVSYTVSGNQITFAAPPLGPRSDNGAAIPAQVFLGRLFQFRNNVKNATYLKKVRQIFQKSGTWIDAANQLKFNREFIVDEAINYAKATYPTLAWNSLETKCVRDIGLIVDAFEHDLRFGGNQKTVDAAESYYNNGSLAYINAQLTESVATYKYVMNLCVAAMRNWDISVDGCTVTPQLDTITVPTTLGLLIGMNVSSGSQFPTGTVITEIISDTEIRVSNAAYDVYQQYIINSTQTQTGNGQFGPVTIGGSGQWTIGVGSIITINSLIGNIDQVTFSFSRINNGTFMDAARLIEKNRDYIRYETLGWVKATYPNLQIPDEDKCVRDTGYLIDAYVYHLRYGGNLNVVDFAERYFVGNKLSYINNEYTESIAAYGKARDLMVLAMRNALTAGTYTTYQPFIDPTVLADPLGSPTCAQVEQTLNTYHDIIVEVLTKGPNIIDKVADNNQRTGNWTEIRTYSNNNILADPNGYFNECSDVSSALNSLFLNIESILNGSGSSVTKSLPDYFDGENKEFELYYTDNTPVRTEEGHDLFVGINGVFQNKKYNSEFPRPNAYYIERSPSGDKIVFVEPPKWEQNLNTILVQEPIAVEKFFAHNVGLYKILTLAEDNFDGKYKGPFVFRDQESKDVVVIDDELFLLVFVDGVLQKLNRAYTINEGTIKFSQPPKKGQRIDIVLLMGENLDQLVNAFNVETTNLFLVESTLSVTGQLTEYAVLQGSAEGSTLYQYDNGAYQVLGNIKKHESTTNGWEVTMVGSNPDYDESLPIRISSGSDIRNSTYLEITLASGTTALSYLQDGDGRALRKDAVSWLYDTTKPMMTGLEVGDKILIDGEDEYRTIKKVPNTTTPLEYRGGKSASNDNVGTVTVTNYNGIVRGEGLNIEASITNGSVTSLSWNKRDYTKNPTASQYNTPPVLTFEPVDSNGGGARAQVVVSGGEVVDVVLIDGGSGYTSAPTVVVSRKYKIIKNQRSHDSRVNRFMNPTLTSMGPMTTHTTINEQTENDIETTALNQMPIPIRSTTVSSSLQRTGTVFVTSPDPVTGIRKTPAVSPGIAVMGSSTMQLDAQTVEQIQTTTSAISSVPSVAVGKHTVPISTTVPMSAAVATTTAKASVLDTDYDFGDTIVFANTSGFSATGYVQVGKYKLNYTSKLSDRFVLDLSDSETVSDSSFGTISAGGVLKQA